MLIDIHEDTGTLLSAYIHTKTEHCSSGIYNTVTNKRFHYFSTVQYNK